MEGGRLKGGRLIEVQLYLERKPHQLKLVFTGPLARLNWNLEMLVFLEGGKPENPKKTLRARMSTNNKLNPHMMPGPGIEPRPHWWEVSALTTVPYLLPLGRSVRFSWQFADIYLKGHCHGIFLLFLDQCMFLGNCPSTPPQT